MRASIIILLFFLIPVAAASSTIDILSVSESEDRLGGVATASLSTRSGSGAVFIDSYPLTRIDTQLSARFARLYACSLAGVDCSQVDFFYTLRAGSSIIGGPSAGAALTVLSYAELTGLPIDRSTTITGTITGSGLIGPVGGIEQKVLAAERNGFSRVLVPSVELHLASNTSSIEVVGVSSVEEAIFYFTGKDVSHPYTEIIVPDEYTAQMADVALQLCERSSSLKQQVSNVSSRVDEWLISSARAAASEKYYSAASFCFSSNLRLQEQLLDNRSQDHLRSIMNQLRSDIEFFDASLPSEFSSVADFEVYMVVRERLLDSFDVLEAQDVRNISSSRLAYAVERFSSAVAWSSFFGVIDSPALDLDEQWLRQSCSQQSLAAQESVNYVSFILGSSLEDVHRDVRTALEYQRQGEWALCIWSSLKARAQAEAITTVAFAGDFLNETVALKHERAGQSVAAASARGLFPVMSYAYFEYAGEVEDVFSKNLYSEYSLSLSMLDLYRGAPSSLFRVDSSRVLLLVFGIIIGVCLGVLGLSARSFYTSRRKK
ncbi:MAG: S16 family serine protease [Candidatus Woesearchaeota archaeon]